MSSACVCHTDNWCFYCEMYVPLEKELDEWKRQYKRFEESSVTVIENADRNLSIIEKERDELQKRVEELERFMYLIVNTTAHPIPETYSLSGHMNAVEYAKHMLKETHNEASE